MKLEQFGVTVQMTALTLKTSLRPDLPFADSCLPRTLSIALESRTLLFPLLRAYPDAWSFIDKIFVMLAPDFREEVEAHYANQGKYLVELYQRSEIERFDKRLTRELSERIKAIRMEKVSAVGYLLY